MPIIISNASPLIGLSAIDRLFLLKDIWGKIIIPDAVFKEVVVDGSGKPGANDIDLACSSWIERLSVKNKEVVAVLQTVLDYGESEVIALGQELKADLLLLDNREPRLFAANINQKVMGTVGLIKLGWKKGLIQEPIQELIKLRLNGFWIEDRIFDQFKLEVETIR